MDRISTIFAKITLKDKLIISLIGSIVIPLTILGIISIRLYSNEVQNTVVKSAIQSNEQVIKNLDSFLAILLKLSEYPIKDAGIKSIMARDYSEEEFPQFEKSRDMDTAKNFLYNIKSFSEMIDSVLLYKAETYEVCGRIPADSFNTAYDISREPWVERIEALEGGYSVIGVHLDLQQYPKGKL